MSKALRIDYYRKRAGLTQAEMAKRLHIRRETLCRLETGRQYLTEAMENNIANLLGLTTDERNHMIGLSLYPGRAAERAPQPGANSQRLWLVAARPEAGS